MTDNQRRKATLDSLEGLSVGDAFGQQFFWHQQDIGIRRTDVPIWRWTDDSQMAFSIVKVLFEIGEIDQDYLADLFLNEFDTARGYGPAMVFDYFHQRQQGVPWKTASTSLFDGTGSYGNGSAMRIAPLGVFFADDLEKVVEQATLSAQVTHSNPEAIAGAIAVAVAAAISYRQRTEVTATGARTFIEEILPYVPESNVKHGLIQAYEELGPKVDSFKVAELVGNGSAVTCQDTVPFCIFLAGQYLNDFEEAMWNTVQALGDMDTNCAIVGGIVASKLGRDAIPEEWIQSRESIPALDKEAE